MKLKIDWLIENANECDYLDFKKDVSINSNENDKNDFIMDIIAFANSSTNDEKYIIFGVEIDKITKEKILHGIKPETLLDGASYQELIEQNVEPRITFETFIFEYDTKKFGVIRIYNCDDKPYFAKKERSTFDHKNDIRKGEAWLRISDHKVKMGKAEHDIIMESIRARYEFDEGKVKILFFESRSEILDAESIGEYEPPSERARKEIMHHLAIEKERNAVKTPVQRVLNLPTYSYSDPFAIKPFEEMSEYELEKALETVKDDYYLDDLFEFFEIHGIKLQVVILNGESTFIDEATIRLQLPEITGIYVSVEEYREHRHTRMQIVNVQNILRNNEREKKKSKIIQESPWIIEGHLDRIRHGIEEQAFTIPPRIAFENGLFGETIELTVSIIAKNLKKPITRTLKIKIISRNCP